MFGERHDPEFLKHLFETTEILRKPISGIISGYHVLPYILVGPQEEQPHRSVEIRGKIKVSPRLVLAPGRAGQTYGDLFKEHEVMDETLVARVTSSPIFSSVSSSSSSRSGSSSTIRMCGLVAWLTASLACCSCA